MIHVEYLGNNRVKIYADSGKIEDVRTGRVYSEYVGSRDNVEYFVEVN